MSRGILYIMSGPSGTGKGTICTELIKTENIYLSISATTREMRAGEEADVTYHYTGTADFEKMIADGEMLEYAKYGSNYYGTPKKYIEAKLQEGIDVLLEIEPQGAMQVKKIYPEAVMLFIIPPSMKELKSRLISRGREDDNQIRERMEKAGWEFSQAQYYEKVFINDNLDECVGRVAEYMHNKARERGFIDKLLKENY